jgi:4'-phosphopantetheinyl transferase EntD
MKVIQSEWSGRALIVRGPLPTEEWFGEDELIVARGFRLLKRRNEWMLSRAAAKMLAVELGLCDGPRECRIERPHLVVGGTVMPQFVSLSHSDDVAGVAIGPAPVGIDVQTLRDLPEESAHLFLTDEETEQMRSCHLPHRILHFWCAKEAAWKRAGGEHTTLTRVPIRLREERADGLVFDSVETTLLEGVIAAITTASV